MIHFARIAAASLLAALTLAPTALAQPADLPTYQGRLTDNGQPANGVYEIEVRYYDSAVGGNLLTGHGYSGVVVTDGLFMIPLNAYQFPSFGSGLGEIWLDLEVRPGGSFDAYTPLTPRQIVTRAPLAHRALNANNADIADTALAADFALTSGTGLTEAYENDPVLISTSGTPISIFGADLNLGSGLNIGDPGASDGNISVYSATTQLFPMVRLGVSPGIGGRLLLNPHDSPQSVVNLGPGTWGGGHLSLSRNDINNPGIEMWGNAQGQGAPRAYFYDENGLVHTRIDANATFGTNALVLRDGAVDAYEIQDEPGIVAARRNAANVTLSTSATAVLTRTITAPWAGFVQMTGIAEVNVTHTTGTPTTITVGIGVNSNSYYNGIEHGHYIPSSAPSGTYIVVVPAHDVTSVSYNDATNVRLLAAVSGGTGKIVDSSLSALYVPTAYGTTAGSVLHNPDANDKTNTIGAITPQLHAAEHEQEQQWSNQQILERMARLEARIEAQESELRELRAEDK